MDVADNITRIEVVYSRQWSDIPIPNILKHCEIDGRYSKESRELVAIPLALIEWDGGKPLGLRDSAYGEAFVKCV